MTDDTRADPAELLSRIDRTVAHPARVWDYWLDGKDHYDADREVGDHILQALPEFKMIARADRQFLGRAVRFLAGEAGVRQFLDIGTGIPSANNTHQVAQSVAPDARVVYVDNDPVVLVHARALLRSTPEGATAYIDADMNDPDSILEQAKQTLDFSQPVALTMLAILEFVPELKKAKTIVGQILDRLPSGSYLVVSAPVHGEAMDRAAALWNESGATTVTIRSREEQQSLFDGLELQEPGLVPLPQWRPDTGTDYTDQDFPYVGGVGKRP
jgi:O-methyltransferase involved in polyketide biosynthesis